MQGKNPFERHVVETSTRSTIKMVPTVEAHPLPVPQDEFLQPTEEHVVREHPLARLLTGEAYEDLLRHSARFNAPRSQELLEQDALDDERFEHLYGEDWQHLSTSEDRIRGARAIARRTGNGTTEKQAQGEARSFDYCRRQQRIKNTVITILSIWTALGAIMSAVELGPVGFLAGGFTFFVGGVAALWVAGLFVDLGAVRGRAV